MTAQVPEILIYEGKTLSFCNEPLSSYFRKTDFNTDLFQVQSTACWRGYRGTWEISGNRLLLTNISGTKKHGEPLKLEDIFPAAQGPIFAEWYSGILRVPRGKMIQYVHMGYESKFEKDLLLTIENGILKEAAVRENGVAPDDSRTDGYSVFGAYRFPKIEDL